MPDRQYVIRGLSHDCVEVWYTGKAGDQFVSQDIADAFTYMGLVNAREKAKTLNRWTALHGYHFMVPCPDQYTWID